MDVRQMTNGAQVLALLMGYFWYGLAWAVLAFGALMVVLLWSEWRYADAFIWMLVWCAPVCAGLKPGMK